MVLAGNRVPSFNDSIPHALNKTESIILELLADGGDINETDIHGRTALMYIVVGEDMFHYVQRMPGRERFVKLLLDHGADPTIEDNNDKTALDYFKQYAGEDHPATQLIEDAMAAPRPPRYSYRRLSYPCRWASMRK